MKPFSALDEVLNANALTPAPSREVAPPAGAGDFQPFCGAKAIATQPEKRVAHEESKLELVQENGRIQQVIVTCRCGERIVLDCAY